MGHLPDNGLTIWRQGDQLTADALNHNTLTLREYAERALTAALMPDPAVVRLEMRLGQIEERLDRIEGMLTQHARQRNEIEYAPLSHLGGVLQRLDGLQHQTQDAVAQLTQALEVTEQMHTDQHLRLSRLEQQPPAATDTALKALRRAHQKSARQAEAALGQAIGLRAEVAATRIIAEGHDRVANRREYAPLATVAHILERVMKLEAAARPEDVPNRPEDVP